MVEIYQFFVYEVLWFHANQKKNKHCILKTGMLRGFCMPM